jgi:hypothetical protein
LAQFAGESANNGSSSWGYLVVILVYALSFGPATYLATKSGFLRRASASKGAVFDFVFYPHYLAIINHEKNYPLLFFDPCCSK